MSWITLAEADVARSLTGNELSVLKTAALGSGQANPLTELISQVTEEVRGFCQAGGFSLGTTGTIPDRLEAAAVSIIRYRLATRLPTRLPATEERKREYEDAMGLLDKVAARKFSIDSYGNAASQVTHETRQATRSELNGL